MNLHYFDQPVLQKLIQAMCHMLVHSLWQGLILAVAAGIILLVTKKSSPALRYNLLSLSLLLFIIGNGFTFFGAFTGKKTADTNPANGLYSISDISKPEIFSNQRGFYEANRVAEIISVFNQFVNANAVLMVTIWLIIFGIKSLKASAGLFYIHRLKKSHSYEPNEFWKQRVILLARQLGIHKPIGIFQSEIVTVPMVFGILKPIIFIPAGLFTRIPTDQLEAILLHELAHIKRSDYLINLIQSFAQNIFFFNPAVLWVSALIRDEREHCCDDLAISVMENHNSFVQALVSFQEYKLEKTSLTMTFPGKRNFLLDRIKRIIYKNNKPLNAMEKLFVTASLLTAAGLIAAFAPLEDNKVIVAKLRHQEMVERSVVNEPEEFGKDASMEMFPAITSPSVMDSGVAVEDTLPKKGDRIQRRSGVRTIELTRNNKRFDVREVDGKITSLKVDGQKISEDKISIYQPEIDEIMEEVEKAEVDAENARGDAEKARAEAGVLRKQADEHRKAAEQMRGEADKMRAEAEKMRVAAEAIRKQADLVRNDAEKQRTEADKDRLKADDQRLIAEKAREKAEVSRKEAEKSRVAFEKMQSELITDLIKEGVVKNKEGLSYKLNANELIVNGAKQPDAVHQKLKSKYVKSENWETVYNFNGRSGISFTR